MTRPFSFWVVCTRAKTNGLLQVVNNGAKEHILCNTNVCLFKFEIIIRVAKHLK